ncbi:undecaprenyl-diphosphate phosphatase [Caldinitratiruptor microaerophilus]|uniref:undecaprenyl-diphosphate phosphatase n=1 Tax=Caldinitratiruptor microaerophilus TaxID=671077 RepID=UPI00222F5167|nr:undecaprenyl-diphosphate phosphatase [Caldinitratiruptor microaerophilus]
MLTLVQAAVLGIVQGITEFLPISSTAHLYLVPWLLGWPEHSLAFDVGLHMGTLVAVTAVFWRDLLDLALAAVREGMRTSRGRLAWGIAAGTVPAALAGLILEDVVEEVLRSPLVMAASLAVLGVVLWQVDRRAARGRRLDQVGFADVVYVGFAQMLALVPGVSRSGITMTAGLLEGLEREAAARISFLLSFPVILGAGVLKLPDIGGGAGDPAFWTGVLTSSVTGFLAIRYLLAYLRRGSYSVFAAYRVGLAVLVVLSYALGYRGS